MRKALIIGIDYYEKKQALAACVNDALSVEAVLKSHADNDTSNFDCQLLIAPDKASMLGRQDLRKAVEKFFKYKAEVAVFYFAGHGTIAASGGYLMASDSDADDPADGLSLNDVFAWVNASPVTHKVIILDCCHSGAAGTLPDQPEVARLRDGVTVLTASDRDQSAAESEQSGLFTRLMVEALKGGAASITGAITPGSLYAFIDQSLGAHEQRPLFRTNVSQFISLRNVKPRIPIAELRQITTLFPTTDHLFRLDPSFEPALKTLPQRIPPPIRRTAASSGSCSATGALIWWFPARRSTCISPPCDALAAC
jgi:hypothetical protein